MSIAFSRQSRRVTRAACWTSGILVTTTFLASVLQGLSYFYRDFAFTAVPRICEIGYLMRHKMSLALSPFIGLGEPMFGNPEAQVLYPFTWIAQLVYLKSGAPDIGASVSVALQMGAAAASAAWLLRTFRLGFRTATIGGLLFVFSGAVINLISHAFYLSAALGLPLCWAAGRRVLQGQMTRGTLLLLFLGFYTLIAGGDVQTLMETGWILLAECLIRHDRKNTRAGSVFIGVSLAAAVLCTSTFLLSAREELSLCRHLRGWAKEMNLSWSYGPLQWLATFWKGLLFQPYGSGESIKKPLYTWLTSEPLGLMAGWNDSPYLGFLWFIALIFGVRSRRTRVAAGVAAAALLLALGARTPILPLLIRWIPGFGLFRYPMKYLLPFNTAALILVASGCDILSRRRDFRKLLLKILGWTLVLTAVMAGIILGFSSKLDGFGLKSLIQTPTNSAVLPFPSLSRVLLQSVMEGGAPLLVAAIAVWAFYRRRFWFEWLILADLLLGAISVSIFGPTLFSKDLISPITQIQSKPPVVLCHQGKLADVHILNPTPEGEEWLDMAVQKLLATPNLGACDQIRLGSPYSVMLTAEQEVLAHNMSIGRSGAARALGCTHWIGFDPPSDSGATRMSAPYLNAPAFERFPVYAVKDPIPEVFLVNDPILVEASMTSERTAALRQKVSENARASDLVDMLDDPRNAQALLPNSSKNEAIRIIDYKRPSPTRALISLEGTGPAIIGLKTSYRLGWRATQAGKTLPTYRVASSLIAAAVEKAEDGPIEWRYEIPYFRLACGLTVFGILLLAGLLTSFSRFGRR